MFKARFRISYLIFFLIPLLVLVFQIPNSIFQIPFVAFASTTDGTIDSAYKYIWGENTGWINFGCSNCNVHVTDTGLTGYAWSENYGWINLDPANGGVENNNEGTLSGYAWGENLGWVDFSGVRINSSGVFSGTASSTISGQISFDCGQCQVKTDWRPASARSTAVSGGGFSLGFHNPPALAIGVLINGGAQYTASPSVLLNLQAGADAKTMAISNSPDFRNISQEPYASEKAWDLCYGRPTFLDCPADNTSYAVYVKFYTAQGQSSESISAGIIYEKEPPKKSFIERLPEILKPFIPEFLKPKPPEIKPPEIPIEELLSKEAPLSLKKQWLLLDPKAIARLVFAPLPKDFKTLVQKLPQLNKTFSEVGITRMTELLKLRAAKLTLPGLTETVGLPVVKIESGEFALPKGIRVAELPVPIKEKLPTEIIFARTAGELIDFNIALTLTEKGKAQQKITTIAGKPLELVIKPDKPVKSVKGYVIFKAKKTQLDGSLKVPFDSLTASLFFARPVFAQARTQPVEVEEKLVLMEFEYTDPDGDGIYTAEIPAPVVDGEYEIITVMDYEDPALGMKEVRLITVVDPEGYVYEKEGDKETRIPGAIISLYWLNPEIKQYELWPAKQYQQENPQTSDITGKYSFIVPEGFYYLKVETPGYLTYDGKPFQVTEGSGVHINIELKVKYWWLKAADWKTVILIVVVLMLLYNFYRDRVREKLSKTGYTK